LTVKTAGAMIFLSKQRCYWFRPDSTLFYFQKCRKTAIDGFSAKGTVVFIL